MLKEIKAELYRLCRDYVDTRMVAAEQAIHSLQVSANEETKSSAGDKYETGRAMMQLEIEKHAGQLTELSKQKQVLDSINVEKNAMTIQAGSLVFTDRENYFLSISAGRFEVSGKKFICISTSSPIGAKMLGLKTGDTFTFNNFTTRIAEIA